MDDNKKSISVLIMNTVAFTVCFACWMTYSILIAHLVSLGEFEWSATQIGALIAIPVLTGSLMRLPLGLLTDIFGGRIVYFVLMLFAAVPMYFVGEAKSYQDFWIAGLGFGVTGASFAVGIAYTSVWFSKERQGTALGIFGAGNAGAALTTLGAPILLRWLPDWRILPKMYAAALVLTAIVFWFLTHTKKSVSGERLSIAQRLAPLRKVRVWRFGLYYVLVFGAFVALTGWLPVYYINVYKLDLVKVGLLSSIFVLPSGLVRALGGWLSDKFGARKIMYWVLGTCLTASSILILPPTLLNVAVFTGLVFMIGIAMGIGKAAVYKFIPDYFPTEIGIVGGLVGVLGGLGGFFCPKLFGIFLEGTGVWTTCWVFLAALSAVCLFWLRHTVRQIDKDEILNFAEAIEGLENEEVLLTFKNQRFVVRRAADVLVSRVKNLEEINFQS
ncbi:MAG: nitrate/nitrite transporter [Candidatus Omnitrophota bacterium]|nr:nitrate/nitrite transporter [Candidatus Omnitrophota bacterium]